MNRTLVLGYILILVLAFSVIFVESVVNKIILFFPLVFVTLGWIGYYVEYKENEDK